MIRRGQEKLRGKKKGEKEKVQLTSYDLQVEEGAKGDFEKMIACSNMGFCECK